MNLRPTCHPDRPYSAKGLCAMCYLQRWRDPDNAKKRVGPYKKMEPIFTPERFIPERVGGVRQNATTSFPISGCPKCRNTTIQYVGREARCYHGCGHSVWLVKEPVREAAVV